MPIRRSAAAAPLGERRRFHGKSIDAPPAVCHITLYMDIPSDTAFSKRFAEYFEIVSANTADLMEEAFKLRYEVFCGCRRLDPAQYPDGLERDDYDADAAHSLLYHRPSGSYAGTLRVILPKPGDDTWMFHIERIAGPHFSRSLFASERIPRHSIGEISRFCLSPRFRARQGESLHPEGVAALGEASPVAGERRALPHPILGLMVAGVRMSWEHGLTFWYAMMEPCLARRLKQFGLEFQPISGIFDYYGPRRAYLAYLPKMFDDMRRTHPPVWHLLTGGGAMAFHPGKCGPTAWDRHPCKGPAAADLNHEPCSA